MFSFSASYSQPLAPKVWNLRDSVVTAEAPAGFIPSFTWWPERRLHPVRPAKQRLSVSQYSYS